MYLSELHKAHSKTNSTLIVFPKSLREMFTINHTQSMVVYKVKGFVDKNVD